MKQYQTNLFGVNSSNLEKAASILEKKLEVVFTLHESSFRGGDYYRYDNKNEDEIILQKNYDFVTQEWSEEEFSDYPFLLYISSRSNFNETISILDAEHNITLLR